MVLKFKFIIVKFIFVCFMINDSKLVILIINEKFLKSREKELWIKLIRLGERGQKEKFGWIFRNVVDSGIRRG